jgi:hypothetical protein
VSQGGEPERDDYGLPRVDIQIPDDARELYRDVQAYRRELRAMRRHDRSRRWRTPLRHSGMVVPLIAGCLVLAMIASMVLTMFTANPHFSGMAGPDRASPGGRPSAASGPPSRSQAGSPVTEPSRIAGVRLPATTIDVAGQPVLLRRLTSTALAIVPSHCNCASLINQLLSQARSAGVPVYLVGNRGSRARLDGYASSARPKMVFVAIDTYKVLNTTYKPVGLTILLVDSRGSVTVALGISAGLQMATQLRSLKRAG